MEKITLPDGWHEVSISTYKELANLDTFEGNHKVIELISILSNQDVEDIRTMNPNDFERILKQVEWTGQLPNTEYKTQITIDEVDYYLVKLKSLTVGEWIDLDTWCENSIENMHKILALLYRPSNDVYNTNEMNERSELFAEKLMIADVYGTLLFFLIIGNQYLNLTEVYMNEQK